MHSLNAEEHSLLAQSCLAVRSHTVPQSSGQLSFEGLQRIHKRSLHKRTRGVQH